MAQTRVTFDLEAEAEIQVCTKNTFVHFEKRDTLARRGTCAGGLMSLRRQGSWNEKEVSTRQNARAATCAPQLVFAIPDLARRDSCATSVSDPFSPQSSACSPCNMS